MSTEENKALLRRYMARGSDGPTESGSAEDFLAPDYQRHRIRHRAPTNPRWPEAAPGQVPRRLFPDLQITVEEIIAEGDSIAFRSTARGLIRRVPGHFAPTGPQVTVGSSMCCTSRVQVRGAVGRA